MPVAVAIDAVLKDIARQHLDHADLTRPGARGAGRIEVVLFIKLKRGEHLGAEQVRTAAIVGQGHQRVERVEIALKGSEIGLKRPERKEDAPRNAIFAFDAVKHGVVFLCIRAAPIDAVLRNQAAREVDERLLEDAL